MNLKSGDIQYESSVSRYYYLEWPKRQVYQSFRLHVMVKLSMNLKHIPNDKKLKYYTSEMVQMRSANRQKEILI